MALVSNSQTSPQGNCYFYRLVSLDTLSLFRGDLNSCGHFIGLTRNFQHGKKNETREAPLDGFVAKLCSTWPNVR